MNTLFNMITAILLVLTTVLLTSILLDRQLARHLSDLRDKFNSEHQVAELELVPEPTELEEPAMVGLGNMTVTIYHAVPGQTDSTPTITASGKDVAGLDLVEARICALSRDLLQRWGGPIAYGDQVYIDVPDPDLRGWWTVEDTMASRWKNHVDLLVPTSRKGGKWTDVEAWTITQ